MGYFVDPGKGTVLLQVMNEDEKPLHWKAALELGISLVAAAHTASDRIGISKALWDSSFTKALDDVQDTE